MEKWPMTPLKGRNTFVATSLCLSLYFFALLVVFSLVFQLIGRVCIFCTGALEYEAELLCLKGAAQIPFEFPAGKLIFQSLIVRWMYSSVTGILPKASQVWATADNFS